MKFHVDRDGWVSPQVVQLGDGLAVGVSEADWPLLLGDRLLDGVRYFVAIDRRTGEEIGRMGCLWTGRNQKGRDAAMADVHEFLRKAKARANLANGATSFTDSEFSAKFPALFAFLSCLTNEDGSERQLSRVTVFVDQGEWRGSLVDPETEQSIFVTLQKPADVFPKLEKALQAPEPDWRVWRKPGTRKRR